MPCSCTVRLRTPVFEKIRTRPPNPVTMISGTPSPSTSPTTGNV